MIVDFEKLMAQMGQGGGPGGDFGEDEDSDDGDDVGKDEVSARCGPLLLCCDLVCAEQIRLPS